MRFNREPILYLFVSFNAVLGLIMFAHGIYIQWKTHHVHETTGQPNFFALESEG